MTKQQSALEALRKEMGALSKKKQARIAQALKNGEPILAGMNETMPEVSTALGIASWFIASIQMQMVSSKLGPELIDEGGDLVGSNFMCSLIRAGVSIVERNMLPTPTMITAATSPCDANIMLGQMVFNHAPWKDIPKFIVDVPYEKSDERMDYFADQQRKMLVFIEKNSGLKLDMDRLREVCEEANKAYHLMEEFQNLKRAKPCPAEWNWGFNAYAVARMFAPGSPDATAWMEKLVDIHEKRVKEKQGIDGVEEKIRYIWFDVLPCFARKIFPRLEKEFGAALIMDMYAYSPPWTTIDTSSEQSMFRSFARRYAADNPMTRQAMASMEMYTGDIKRIVNDYGIDAVILPTHRGHKDVNASVKIIRDMCKDIGIPFTTIGCDMFDERYMSADRIIEKIGLFFESAGLM